MRRRHRRSAACLAAAVALTVAFPPAAGSETNNMSAFAAPSAVAAPRWFDGLHSSSSITNCASIIFPPQRIEDGAWNWVGFYSDESDFPDAGQVFYIHTVFAAVGNSCSGQRGYPEIALPSGVQLAISQQTPVFCWAIDFANHQSTQETQACPQQGYQASYGGQYAFPALNQPPQYAGTWPMPQGQGWELQIPVVSNRQLRGTLASPCDCVHGFTKILDGNSSPVLNPNAGLVNDPPPSGGGGGGGGGTTPGGGGAGGGGTTPGGGGGTTPNVSGGGNSSTSGSGTGSNNNTPPPPSPFSALRTPGSLQLATLLRTGGFTVTAIVGRAGSRIDAVLTGSPRGASLAAGHLVLAKATRKNVPAGSATVKLRLTRAGKRALRRVRRGRARLTVSVTAPGAAKVSKSKTLRLRSAPHRPSGRVSS